MCPCGTLGGTNTLGAQFFESIASSALGFVPTLVYLTGGKVELQETVYRGSAGAEVNCGVLECAVTRNSEVRTGGSLLYIHSHSSGIAVRDTGEF
jgi:hypothetical protein